MKPSAFIHLATWQRVYREFAAALGIHVEGGDSSQLPGGCAAFQFDTARGESHVPFWVSRRGATEYWINGGVLIFCGGVFYFPGGRYYGGTNNIIGLRLKFDFEAVTNGVGFPWDIHARLTDQPRIEGVSLSTFNTSPPVNCEIRDLDAGPGESITHTPGNLVWPLALAGFNETTQLWKRGNLCLYIQENGRLLTAVGYPAG